MENLYLANKRVYLLAESYADAEKLYYTYNDMTLTILELVSDAVYVQDFDSVQVIGED